MDQPPQSLNTEAELDSAISVLLKRDPRLIPVAKKVGRPPLRRRPDGFSSLVSIIVSQQISVASATAIHQRITSSVGEISARTIADAGEEGLRLCGLSRPKIRTFLKLAEATLASDIDFVALRTASDQEVTASLTALHGIGPWSAEIYLLTCLGRYDVWPAGDIALQEAMKLVLGLDQRPKADDTFALAEPWRPQRSVAARLLWSYYSATKNMSRETGGSI